MNLIDPRTHDVNAAYVEPPPELIVWVPPGGAVVQCNLGMDAAKRECLRVASQHPGTVVAVYQLIGTACVPVTVPEFVPHEQSEEAKS